MCGRFTLFESKESLSGIFGVQASPWPGARYNIAPSRPVAAVRIAPEDPGRREWTLLRWGLVPPWAKDPAIGNRMINARAETVAQKPAFRSAWKSRRCLIPANGFYEWQRRNGRKQPWYVRMRGGKPFAIAGLWERWEPPSGEPIESCALITTVPNDLLAPIHGRMPAILPPAEYDRWLSAPPGEAHSLLALLRPFPAREMEAWEVGLWVNRPENDSPDLIAPLRG
ncbi:MAG: SOS response-associated peptidase [Deltaproteobacteria bacterium]